MKLLLERVHVANRLREVTLSVAGGQLCAVIGENGAGKSTLLDVLAGVLRPDGGAVTCVDDGDATHDVLTMRGRARARLISSLGAREPHVDDLVVAARIAQGLVPRDGVAWPADGVDARVASVAAALGCDALLHRRVGTLSTGERRRVSVARALVDADSRAVVLDEPLAGVDVARQPLVLRALRARASAGAAVVFSVHELGAALIADRVVGLSAGRIVVDTPPTALHGDALEAVFGVRTFDVVRLGRP